MNRLLRSALPAIFLAGCSQPSTIDYARAPIEVPGTFPCFNNQLVVKVTHAFGGKLNYSIENAKVAIGATVPPINESAPWIIFPEAVNKVWIYNGADDVTLIETYEDGGSKFTSSQVVSGLLSRAPPEFAQRLPAGVSGKPG